MRRWRMSDAAIREAWQRRQQGETYRVIAAALGCHEGSVYFHIQKRGGVPPRVRHRAARVLSRADREEISRGLAAAESFRALARRLQRAPSTISREVARHGGRTPYRATVADAAAWQAACRPKPSRLATCARLRQRVTRQLQRGWSPEQIAGWLRWRWPDNPAMHVSHETIYQSLYVQARGGLKRALVQHLRRRRPQRRPRRWAGHTGTRLADVVSIRERPAAVEDRAVPGHWEGDLLRGQHQSHIVTLVERQSRFVVLIRLPHTDAPTVAQALARRVQRLPAALRQSLTWDRGGEMAHHRRFTVATNVQVYFCDPQSPWQRGSNENTNGLLRQYLPRGLDFTGVSQVRLNQIARLLNTRPRKTLQYETPADRLAAAVAATA